jgi:hypothetical protein
MHNTDRCAEYKFKFSFFMESGKIPLLDLLKWFIVKMLVLELKCSVQVRLWDIRSDQEVCQYKPPTPNSSFTSVGVSLSGRIIFASRQGSLHSREKTTFYLYIFSATIPLFTCGT